MQSWTHIEDYILFHWKQRRGLTDSPYFPIWHNQKMFVRKRTLWKGLHVRSVCESWVSAKGHRYNWRFILSEYSFFFFRKRNGIIMTFITSFFSILNMCTVGSLNRAFYFIEKCRKPLIGRKCRKKKYCKKW